MTTRSIICLLGFIICLNVDSFGEDIVLKSGKTYKNIDVYKQEADRLLITHPGGMATIYLKDCPADIQQKYNYNPAVADAAVSEREKTVQATHQQLQRDQKTQVDNWKKQQAANEQQKANDEMKYIAAKKENERLGDAQKKEENEKLINAQKKDQQQEINKAERGIGHEQKLRDWKFDTFNYNRTPHIAITPNPDLNLK